MNSSGEFLNGSRAAAVVGLSCPWARAGRPRGSAGRAQAALGPRRPRSTAGGKASQRRIHPQLKGGITRQQDFCSPPSDHQPADWSSHSSTSLQTQMGQKDIEASLGGEKLSLCREMCQHSNRAIVAVLRNKQTIVSEPSP